MGWRLLTLFVISGALRFLVALTIPQKIREVRPVEKMSTKDLIARVLGLKPMVD
ncbi:MAG: hypothetical protein PHT59_06320 [Candidatus Omnitrophica bacterium]|nr:hypothetical protein [Candidatus Omnitrophota bacterium]